MIYINGRFLTQKITGVQRYAVEVVKELDQMDLQEEIIILSPKNTINNLELKNIKIQQIGKHTGHIWEQVDLPLYIKKQKNNAKLLGMCNIGPILYPGYVVLHDIAFKTHPEHLNWKFALWYQLITKLNIKRYKHIFTVSNFSKEEILKNYKVNKEKITVTYDSAEHIKNIVPDESIIDKLNLQNKEFYFSLGSKSPHKNHKFIVESAKQNPNLLFVVSGSKNSIFNDNEEQNINNLVYTDYITDEEMVALYKNCKAFIFPSLYEGFGIPPLEAIECGCKNIIISDIPVFKEIYENSVNYIELDLKNKINIKNYMDKNINLDSKKYSWKSVTQLILNEIRR